MFRSSEKIRPFFFGTWSKVLIILKIPLLELLIKCQKRTDGFFHLIKSLIKRLIKWQLFRRLIECIIETFNQVKSLKKFDQVKMKLSIKWKMTISIKWNSIYWLPLLHLTPQKALHTMFLLHTVVHVRIQQIRALDEVFNRVSITRFT